MSARRLRLLRLLRIAALALSLAPTPASAADAPRPNVVFVLADDLGWGDLSSYGATDVATPNVDRLAREGIRFTDFYAVGNTCSPSRAALMTGRYPPRSGVNAVLFHDTPEGLPHGEITLPELLRDAGYATAMIGKWHLGSSDEFMPWHHGFDEFYGVPYSNDEKNFFVWDGRRRLPEAVDHTQLTRRYTDRALAFLDRAAQQGRPFFLYYASNAPHVPLDPSPGFAGRSKRGTYGDVVQELDASVGALLDRLAALGLDRDTIVIFSSDNGPWLAMRDWGGSAGGLRGGKTGTFEGGHRVPALARWPAAIPAATEARAPADMMDWLPTLAELAGARVPDDRVVDGRSLVGVLRGTGERAARPFFYLSLRPPLLADPRHRVGAVRDGRWKLKLPKRGYPGLLEPWVRLEFDRHGLLLFDLEADPGERHDVSGEHPDVVARLQAEIEGFEAAGGFANPPVRIDAAPRDARGWDRLWRDVARLGAALLVAGLVVLFVVVAAVRFVLRRR